MEILLWTLTSRIAHAPSQTWATNMFQNTTTHDHFRRERKRFCRKIRRRLTKILEERANAKGLARNMENLRAGMYIEYVQHGKNNLLSDLGS